MIETAVPTVDLDDRTIRELHATGALDENTATYWLLLLSAQERASRGADGTPAPAR